MTIIQKPIFKETIGITTIDLPEFNLQFNAQRVGLMSFANLRNANYGAGFRMSTMPQLIPLVYSLYENRRNPTARDLAQKLRDNPFSGNTGILYTYKGMFVQDNPEAEKEGILSKINMDEKSLKDMLGSREEKGVVFSDDGRVRFTPYGFKVGSQRPSVLAKNRGVIAFAGGEEKAEMLALASKYYKIKPEFEALQRSEFPAQVRFANIHSCNFGAHIYVDAGASLLFNRENYTFGVRELKQGEQK